MLPVVDTRLLVDGRDVGAAEVAASRRRRSKGLLGRDGLDGVLWLEPARQVHTFRMRFAIDIAHLDRAGRVLVVRTLVPGRLGPWVWRSRTVIESEAGRMEEWGVRPGAVVSVLS